MSADRLSDLPRYRGVIVQDSSLGILPWVEEGETELDSGQKLLAASELLFPANVPPAAALQRTRALRDMFDLDRVGDKLPHEKWTAPFGHAFALGWAPTPDPAAPGLLVPQWKFAIYTRRDTQEIGTLFLDADKPVEEGDSVEPFLLVNTEYGRGLERTVRGGLRRMETQGAATFPYRHLLSLWFRTGRVLRQQREARAAPAPAPRPEHAEVLTVL